MLELEKTFLAKFLPQGIENCSFKEIIDVYIPKEKEHPTLRIRKNGSRFEMTKKEPVAEDISVQEEQTIILTEQEFAVLEKTPGKKIEKTRYYCEVNGRTAEIDVFQGALKGLVLVDFEFPNEEEKNSFAMPDFCLAEVTQKEFLAGGKICGKKYSDIKEELEKFGYKKISLP